MGSRSWMKYLGIASAFAGVGMRVYSWLNEAQADGEITLDEVADLSPVIQDAINQGLQAADVPIIAEVKLTYLG